MDVSKELLLLFGQFKILKKIPSQSDHRFQAWHPGIVILDRISRERIIIDEVVVMLGI